MKIKKILSRSRRDFDAIYICEHCEEEHKDYGYDDANFHDNVIPKMVCKNCGKIAGDEYVALGTKYAASEVI